MQAAALTFYIFIATFLIQNAPNWLKPVPQFISAFLFLLFFAISILISASIILGYPITLFFDGQRKIAIQMVLWSTFWLFVIFIFFLVFFVF